MADNQEDDMSTLEYSKSLTISHALIVSLLLVSACQGGHEADVSGEWEIIEPNNSYRVTLDRNGNGLSTGQGRQFTTTSMKDRQWQGTWRQADNDSEGQFELVLSEDGTQAKGNWWATRAGMRKDIPARQEGGSWVWKRLPVKSKSQEIEKIKEDTGGVEVFSKQARKMEGSREASERANFIPKPSKMGRSREELVLKLSRKMERNKEDKKKDSLFPKLVQ